MKIKLTLGIFTVFLIFLFVFVSKYNSVIFTSTSPAVSAAKTYSNEDIIDTLDDLNNQLGGKLRYGIDGETRKVVMLDSQTAGIPLKTSVSGQAAQNTTEKIARQFLGQLGFLFGINDQQEELKLVRIDGNFIPSSLSPQSRTLKMGQFDPTAMSHVRFQQIYKQIPVFGGEIIVHINSDGSVTSVNGKFLPQISISTAANISAQEAKQLAQDFFNLSYGAMPESVKQPELYILNPSWISTAPSKISLAWRVEASGISSGRNYLREHLYFDAKTGEALGQLSKIYYAINRSIYDCEKNGRCPSWPDQPARTESQPPANNEEVNKLFGHLGVIYTYFQTNHQRSGANDEGGIGSGNYFSFYEPDPTPTVDPSAVVSGGSCAAAGGFCGTVSDCTIGALLGPDCTKDGYSAGMICCQKPLTKISAEVPPGNTTAYLNAGPLAAYDPDIGAIFIDSAGIISALTFSAVAHEFTHAITEISTHLEYYGQSGAINEAMSDIFAVLAAKDTKDWTVKLLENGVPKTLRNLAKPAQTDFPASPNMWPPKNCFDMFFNSQGDRLFSPPLPDRLSSPDYYCPTSFCVIDHLGVHVNTGVILKLAYLISEGTTAEPDGNFNSCQFAGIGPVKTAMIFYDTLTKYLTEASNFRNQADGLITSCKNIYGPDSPECRTVTDAAEATEIIQQPYDRQKGAACPQLCIFGIPGFGCDLAPISIQTPNCTSNQNQPYQPPILPTPTPAVPGSRQPTNTPTPAPTSTPTPTLATDAPTPTPTPAAVQTDADFSIYLLDSKKTDRKTGATYNTGETVDICYKAPAGESVIVSKKTGTTTTPLFTSNKNDGCVTGIITLPAGRHYYFLEISKDGQTIVKAQTFIEVKEKASSQPPPARASTPTPTPEPLTCIKLANLNIFSQNGTDLKSTVTRGQDFFCKIDADKINYRTVCALRSRTGTIYDVCRKYANYGYNRWENKTVVFRCNTKCAESTACDRETLPTGDGYEFIAFDFSSHCGPNMDNVVTKPAELK